MNVFRKVFGLNRIRIYFGEFKNQSTIFDVKLFGKNRQCNNRSDIVM